MQATRTIIGRVRRGEVRGERGQASPLQRAICTIPHEHQRIVSQIRQFLLMRPVLWRPVQNSAEEVSCGVCKTHLQPSEREGRQGGGHSGGTRPLQPTWCAVHAAGVQADDGGQVAPQRVERIRHLCGGGGRVPPWVATRVTSEAQRLSSR